MMERLFMAISLYGFKTPIMFTAANSVIIDANLGNKLHNKQEFK
jgi:hypothetical protein